MASPVKFRVDMREFESTLRKYSEYNKRDIPTIANTKAYRIGLGAIKETPKVSPEEIREFLNRDGGALIGKLINKQHREKGDKGLYGKAMTRAIAIVRASRMRSLAFLKSGWVWGVKQLAMLAEKRGAPRMDRSAKTFGAAKGSAIPAKQGWRVSAKIINTVTAKWDKRDGAAKVAEPALQRAFDAETADMQKYIERKMSESARKAGIKIK